MLKKFNTAIFCPYHLNLDKSKTTWSYWDDEPGTSIWKLERKDETISVHIYESKKIPKDRKRLKQEEIHRTDFEAHGDFYWFIKGVAESFEKAKKLDNESKYYEREWRCKFPDAELNRLNHSFRQSSKRADRNDGCRLNRKDMD